MAAATAFAKVLDEHVIGIISSFLVERSVAATCGTEASDMATLDDISDIADASCVRPLPYVQWLVYQERLELEWDWI